MISWNVNGLRAIMKKNFMEFFLEMDADFLALQEIKMQEGQQEMDLPGYYEYYNYAEKKGYSGTAVFTKHEPLNVVYGIGIEDHDKEGRVITLEYPDFYFVTVYTPNSQNALKRLPYREAWEVAFQDYLSLLDKMKPIILCGDLNVAHTEIDLKNPETNHLSAGFSDEDRAHFTSLLNRGFTDTFRYFNPEAIDRYTWWSYRTRARDRNAGWRIDYFVVSDRLQDNLVEAEILDQVMGSDHCPVLLEIDI